MIKFNDFVYERPDLSQLEVQFKELLETFNSADTVDVQIDVIKQMNQIRNHIFTHMNLAYTRASIDTTDAFYSDERDFFDNNMGTFNGLDADYFKALQNSSFKQELEQRFGRHLFDLAYNIVNSYSDEVKELINEETRVSSEYSKLIASAEIEFEGETYTIPQMDVFIQSKDRATRKKGVESVQKFMQDNLDTIDDIFDRLVKIRHEIAQKLGYDNFIKLGYMRMQRIGYDQSMVETFRNQVADYVVPVATKLYEEQAKRIGVDQLKFYDEQTVFLDGNEVPKDEPEVILNNGSIMYNELSEETGKFYQFMRERDLFDVLSKKGKEAGGYCTFFEDYKSPFIFANFNKTDHDITVLTHEAGHAFQVYSSQNLELTDYLWPTHEACEIHSMSMEFLTYPWMHLFFDNDEKFKYKHLGDAIKFLAYGVAVDEFQHRIYENPELSPKERRAVWLELEAKYLPHRDYDGIMPLSEGSFWFKQGHIFNSPFYYIDYTLAQVCALQFFKRSRENFEDAWKDYVHLCEIGGSKSFIEIIDEAHLASPFIDGTLEDIVKYSEDYISSIDTSNF